MTKRARALRDRVVRGCDRASLPGRHDLPRMEREAAEQPERAAGPACARGPERTGGVLEDRQVGVAIERRRSSEEVDGEDRLCPRRDAGVRVSGVHVHRHRVDVDEHGGCTCERDDVPGGGEGVGGDEHLVAGAEAEREHRDMQGRGARGDGDGVRRSDRICQELLELDDLRAHRQLTGLEDVADLGELGLADVWGAEPDYVSAGLRALYHAIVLSRPSSSSTFASKPMSSRAFSTFGMRSSTSTYSSGAKTMSPGQPVRRLTRCARSKIVTAERGLPTL